MSGWLRQRMRASPCRSTAWFVARCATGMFGSNLSLTDRALLPKMLMICSPELIFSHAIHVCMLMYCSRGCAEGRGHSFRNNWKRMYTERPFLRTDGLYVSRNTYFRLGVVHWEVKNPVHLVVYYRYFRFFPNGTVITRTSPEPLHNVWQSLFKMPNAFKSMENRLGGRWKLLVCSL
jgi:hypothetical protein